MGLGTIRGENGGTFIDDTTPTTGEWHCFVVAADAVVAAITMPDFTNSNALVGLTLVAGTTIFGEITAITLASGTVQMIKY